MTLYSYKGLLLLFGTFLAWETRKVMKNIASFLTNDFADINYILFAHMNKQLLRITEAFKMLL